MHCALCSAQCTICSVGCSVLSSEYSYAEQEQQPPSQGVTRPGNRKELQKWGGGARNREWAGVGGIFQSLALVWWLAVTWLSEHYLPHQATLRPYSHLSPSSALIPLFPLNPNTSLPSLFMLVFRASWIIYISLLTLPQFVFRYLFSPFHNSVPITFPPPIHSHPLCLPSFVSLRTIIEVGFRVKDVKLCGGFTVICSDTRSRVRAISEKGNRGFEELVGKKGELRPQRLCESRNDWSWSVKL